MTMDAYTLTEKLKNLVEDSMAHVSHMAESLDILSQFLDHPEFDRAIAELKRFYRNNKDAHAMVCRLNLAVQGKQIRIER